MTEVEELANSSWLLSTVQSVGRTSPMATVGVGEEHRGATRQLSKYDFGAMDPVRVLKVLPRQHRAVDDFHRALVAHEFEYGAMDWELASVEDLNVHWHEAVLAWRRTTIMTGLPRRLHRHGSRHGLASQPFVAVVALTRRFGVPAVGTELVCSRDKAAAGQDRGCPFGNISRVHT